MERKRRSELLTKEEHKAFIKLYKTYYTKVDAEAAFGISRQVLDLVSMKGSGSSDTVNAIRKILAVQATEAA